MRRTTRSREDIRHSARLIAARAFIATFLAAMTGACGGNPVTPTTTSTTTTTTTTQSAPTVTAISPATGTDEGGTTVTITGTGFSNVSSVVFGSTTATFTVNSDTTITATAPVVAAGIVDIVVTTAAGSSAVSEADRFEFAPNVLTSLSFSAASVAAGLPMRGELSVSFPAPTAGIRIPLAWSTSPSGSGAALYPLTASVPAGATSGSFQVTTFFVSSSVTVQVSADRGGQTRTASFVIVP